MLDTGARSGLQTGLVFDIKRFALHDGPGIRTTVFLKGCPLSCTWCHNPESQSPVAEVLFREDVCTGCSACVAACTEDAITLTKGVSGLDRSRCTGCGACADVCPTGARSLCGETKTVSALVDHVERDILFYDQSGGGMTLSGGEPLMQADFCVQILEACRRRRIHTTVDTCGYADAETLRAVADAADLFLFDIKSVDDDRHRAAIGVSNRPILENLRQLNAWGSRLWIRIPLVPGFNDDPAELQRIGALTSTIACAEAVHLLPYHAAGTGKNEQIGRCETQKSLPTLSEDAVERAAEILRSEVRVPVMIGG